MCIVHIFSLGPVFPDVYGNTTPSSWYENSPSAGVIGVHAGRSLPLCVRHRRGNHTLFGSTFGESNPTIDKTKEACYTLCQLSLWDKSGHVMGMPLESEPVEVRP